jgi:hypothetical protein
VRIGTTIPTLHKLQHHSAVRRRALAALIPLITVAGTLATGSTAQADSSGRSGATSATTSPSSVEGQDDTEPALAEARAKGSRVEIIARRQESSTTWANPDGTFSTQLDSGPVRYLRAGRWENIDSTLLHDLTGQIRTRSTPNSVSLFNGDTATSRRTSGDRPLLRFDRGSSSLTLAWRGSMPPPQVTGNTATYPSVTPGTDVVVTSTPAGLQQNTVLTSRPGTAVSYTVPIKMRGLSTRVKHGAGVDFVDNNGIVVATMPEPQMWAANIDPVSQTKSKLAPVS